MFMQIQSCSMVIMISAVIFLSHHSLLVTEMCYLMQQYTQKLSKTAANATVFPPLCFPYTFMLMVWNNTNYINHKVRIC